MRVWCNGKLGAVYYILDGLVSRLAVCRSILLKVMAHDGAWHFSDHSYTTQHGIFIDIINAHVHISI